MTRINVIDPIELTDQHLMAEYRELPMVMGSLRRSLVAKNGLPKIGDKYTLNAGHVKFFYNKGKFLHRRYLMLIGELMVRGYNLDPNRKADFQVFLDNNLYHDWTPEKEAYIINKQRIDERINQKPHWYRYYGKPLKDVL
jgi:deoxyribonuclease (pyrimidine dimer)